MNAVPRSPTSSTISATVNLASNNDNNNDNDHDNENDNDNDNDNGLIALCSIIAPSESKVDLSESHDNVCRCGCVPSNMLSLFQMAELRKQYRAKLQAQGVDPIN